MEKKMMNSNGAGSRSSAMKRRRLFAAGAVLLICCLAFVGAVGAAEDVWDGTADASWYNGNDSEFTLTTAEQLAGFAQLVDGGETFADKTVKLGADMDLQASDENGNRINFNPIGHSSNGKSFNGIFDGQGHIIKNMYQQSNLDSNNGGWLYEGEYYGLFAYTNGAAIKNLKIEGAYISSGRNEAACVVGNAVDTTFSNIDIINATLIAYNNSAGGVAAECYGECSFEEITVDEDTVIGPLWGTYDVRLGGVVGLVHSGNSVMFKNITVACQLDAINDVAANYQYWLYRYCGMLIGHVDGVNSVADPTGYVTCENVEVIYGDWVNYHYCEDADLGAGSYNGPGEYKYARVEAGTGTDGIDLSTCNHNDDESHNVLIVFDQLFGGGQGVSGLKTYDGVSVVYPEFTITFDTDGGSEIDPIMGAYNTDITAPDEPTREGYTFAGWDTEIPATMPAEDMTVKAQWTINQYTITFNTGAGSTVESITQDYGTPVTAPADPTKDGYTFAGWDTEIPATMPAKDMTITARWEENLATTSGSVSGISGYRSFPRFTENGGLVDFGASKVIKAVLLPEGSSGSVVLTVESIYPYPEELETEYTFDISVEKLGEGMAYIHFEIPVSTLESLELTPADICAYHFEGEVWTKLPTTYEVKDGTVCYEAETDSFSPFKLVIEEGAATQKEEENVPTVPPTEEPDVPDEPEILPPIDEPTKPADEPETPAPILAVLAGLGAAFIVRRK